MIYFAISIATLIPCAVIFLCGYALGGRRGARIGVEVAMREVKKRVEEENRLAEPVAPFVILRPMAPWDVKGKPS